ncbi:uncharacterized protein J3R85_013613 [Psidium guajava]|nr:uncharacterized protein J3R85_013613 [Psidium guajava]
MKRLVKFTCGRGLQEIKDEEDCKKKGREWHLYSDVQLGERGELRFHVRRRTLEQQLQADTRSRRRREDRSNVAVAMAFLFRVVSMIRRLRYFRLRSYKGSSISPSRLSLSLSLYGRSCI